VPVQSGTYRTIVNAIVNAIDADVRDHVGKERPGQEGGTEKLKMIPREELSQKMVLQMQTKMKLTDDQINDAFAAVMLAWERGSHCHIHVNPGAKPETYDYDADGKDFGLCVAEVDPEMTGRLQQYIEAGMKKYVLFSSVHASLLVALPGKGA
jgi:hypothetical protein